MIGTDYAIVDGARASAADRRRMASLLFSTSYLEYCSAANKLGVPCVELQQRTNIEPYLPHLRVLVCGPGSSRAGQARRKRVEARRKLESCGAARRDPATSGRIACMNIRDSTPPDDTRRLAGFYVAATLHDLAGVATGRPYRDEMQALDDAYEAFVDAHTSPGDYFVASLAIEPRDRGRGLFHRLFDDIVARARAAGSPRVVLAVWESNDALALYRNKGMRSLARFDTAWPLFFDRLWLLALPLPIAAAQGETA